MEIFAENMRIKIGELSKFGISPRLSAPTERVSPRLLILHGWPEESTRMYLDEFDWVLCIATDGCSEPYVRDNGRIRGISWGMPNLGDLSRHPTWKQSRFMRFVTAVLKSNEEPRWELLAAPKVPEHVIACYLCSLAAISPQDQWRAGFEEEIEYLRTEGVRLEIDWDRDRANSSKLKAVLLESKALVEGRS
ncbi:MAG: hypothetical protein ACYDHE_15055 [Candidatus Acidiferrales bacterium]